jgi:hypothetical protein
VPEPTIDPIGTQRRETPMTIGGGANPDAHVIVTTGWEGHEHGATAGPNGRWGATFQSPSKPGTHNVTVTHRSADGTETTTSTSFNVR